MSLLEAFIEETSYPDKPWPTNAQDYPSGAKILAESPSEKLIIVHAALLRLDEVLPPLGGGQDWNVWSYSPKRHMAGALQLILRTLFQLRLPMSPEDVVSVLKTITRLYQPNNRSADYYFHWLPLAGIVRNLEWYCEVRLLSSEQCDLLQQIIPMLENSSNNHQKNSKLADRISKLPGVVRDSRPDSGEAWAEKALSNLDTMPIEKRTEWDAIFTHAVTAESAKPSTKWLVEAARHRQAVGEDEATRYIAEWLQLVAPPPPFTAMPPPYPNWSGQTGNGWTQYQEELKQFREEHNSEIEAYSKAHARYFSAISEKNIAILKGLTWYVADSNETNIALGLGHLVSVAFTSIRERGSWATRAGNAGIWALGQMPNGLGVGPLARLGTKLRDRGALKLIAAAMETAAKNAGMTVDELEDLAVPTGGLEPAGVRQEVFGEEGSATLRLDSQTGQTKIEWFGADGKPRKAVPAGVKREFGPEVKALKAAEEEVKSALSAQSARFDQWLLTERSWPLAVWRERYAAHPVLGNLARRLLWTFDGIAGLPTEELLNNLAETTDVRLWHPLGAAPEEVMRWRDTLETRGIVQPFKQAHREVYLLTDAERTTRTYSNRFAAHILKQHQFNSLCILRGWKNSLRLMVDDFYPPATRDLPLHNLRAEFWVEGIGDDYGVDTNDAGTYLRLATDQVRFYRLDAAQNSAHASGGGYVSNSRTAAPDPIPLDQVPPLVLSEIMRDVDLFVGVSSVGNDPAWADGGPEGRFRDYWNDYAFGDLGETAKTRAELLGRLLPRLKIVSRCQIDGKFLTVRGDIRTYKIHLGSGNILMEPNDQYLCIVPGRSEESSDLFLPFEGDRMLAIILSKAFLLADDRAIKDPAIVSQIRRSQQ